MSNRTIAARVAELAPWFHNLRLDGVETAPGHFLGDFPANKFMQFRHLVPPDLTGKSVLDIGCNAGFYSIEMKRRGAARVVALDTDPRYLDQARLAFDTLGLDVELHRMSVYDVGALQEHFDLVLFLGVFYHLRHPLLALDLIYERVAGGDMLFQSLQRGPDHARTLEENYGFAEEAVFNEPGFPALHFIERRYADDPTNWFIPNPAGMRAMLRSSGFAIRQTEGDVHLCARTARDPTIEMAPLPPGTSSRARHR